jgi:hypothetical protein
MKPPISPDQLQWVVDHNMQIRAGHRVQILDAAEAWRKDLADLREAHDIIRAIIYASDGCHGHRGCEHSMEPWQRARALVYRIDGGPDSPDT